MSVSSRLRDLSIRNKLVIAFAALVLLFVVLGGTAMQRFAAMDASARSLATNSALAIGYLGDIRQAVLSYRATLLRALVMRDSSPAAMSALDAAMQTLDEQLDQALAKYAPTVDSDEERQYYQAFQTKWAEFRKGTQPLRTLIGAGKFDESLAVVRVLGPLGNEIEAVLQKDAVFNQTSAADLADDVTQENRNGFQIVVATVLVSVLIAALAGWLLVRAIAVPVRAITGAMHSLANRDLAAAIPGVGRGDEIGAMAGAVQVFKDNMIAADRQSAERAAEQTAKEERAARLAGLVHNFETNVAGLVQALAAASTRDGGHGAIDDGDRRPDQRAGDAGGRFSRCGERRRADRGIGRRAAVGLDRRDQPLRSSSPRRSPARRWWRRSAPMRSCMRWPKAHRRSATWWG